MPKKTLELIHGDAFEHMDTLDDNSVGMVFMDPPYGTTSCSWDSCVDLQRLWMVLNRIAKPGRAIVSTASQPFTSVLVSSNIKRFKCEWIWLKNRSSNFGTAKWQPMKCHESVLVFSSDGKKVLYNPIKQARPESTTREILAASPGEPSIGKDKSRSDPRTSCYQKGLVWQGLHGHDPHWANPKSTQPFKCDRGLHPTQKPVALAEYFIRTYSNPGDLVLDPFAGSGTTGVAAGLCDREALLIEQDERYCEIARERMASPCQRKLLSST